MGKALRQVIAPLASLRLTVVVMTLLIALIFFGTWAQRTRGIWWVMDQYFTSWWVMVPFSIFAPAGKTIPGSFPFPGGALLGTVMLINLLAAHTLRFKLSARGLRLVLGLLILPVGIALIVLFQSWGIIGTLKAYLGLVFMLAVGLIAYTPAIAGTWLLFGRRVGIVLIHISLILLIVGEMVTRSTAVETLMPIYEGQTVNWTQDMREFELAVFAPTEPDAETERVVVFPQAVVKDAAVSGQPLTHPDLPFELRVERFMHNTVFAKYRPGVEPPPGMKGLALEYGILPVPRATGVGESMYDFPGAVISVQKDGTSLGQYALSTFTMAMIDAFITMRQDIAVGEDTWQIDMRFRRYYQPFGFELLDFRHDTYPGTDTPLNFSSDLRITRPETGEDREVHIKMNQPLRYSGLTFFQSRFIPGRHAGEDDLGTILQVVKNPGSTMPYIACALGGIGLVIHFVISLVKYTRKSVKLAGAGEARNAQGVAL